MSASLPEPDCRAVSAGGRFAIDARNLFALAIALISWLTLYAQTDLTIERVWLRGMRIWDGFSLLSSYLTNLTTLLCAISFSALFLRRRSVVGDFFRRPQIITAVVAYLLFVAIAYHLLLRQLWHPTGFRAVINESLHTVIPLMALIYWIIYVPRFRASLKTSFLWLVYPFIYLSLTLWRGKFSGFYPYPFLNVGRLGYPRVLLNVSGLFAGFFVLMGLLFLVNKSGKTVFSKRSDVMTVPVPTCSDGKNK